MAETAAVSEAEASERTGGGRALRLRYNTNFLPEYVSTVIISSLTSWFFLEHPPPGAQPLAINGHAGPAAFFFVTAAGWLVYQTVHYRRMCCPVTVVAYEAGPSRLFAAGLVMDLPAVERIEERLTTFFGRITRSLEIHDVGGNRLRVFECLVEYDGLKRVLERMGGLVVESGPPHAAEGLERARSRWRQRHQILAPPEPFDVPRFGFRLLCLFPVAFVDFLMNGLLAEVMAAAGHPDLAVYAGPLTLLGAALIARYVYYYLFTSVILNRRVL